jgi:hypothetical protein
LHDTGYAAVLPNHDGIIRIFFDRKVLRKGLIGNTATLWDWSFMTPSEIVAKNLIYDVLEPASHCIMVEEGMGFVHGSAIANKKGGFLFTGRAGSGKTAMCLEGVKRGYKYMNDDLSIVDKHGYCHHHTKKLQMYGYNMKHHPELKSKVFQSRSYLDMIQWNFRYAIRGQNQVRRRVAPNDIFKGAIEENARLTCIFFLQQGNKLEIKTMPGNDFALESLEIISKEFSEYVHTLEMFDPEGYRDFKAQTIELLEKLSDRVRCVKISIPRSFDPSELYYTMESDYFG